MKFLSQAILEEKLEGVEWRFIFIIPHRSRIVFPQSKVMKLNRFWDRAKLFAAELDTDRREHGDSVNAIPNESESKSAPPHNTAWPMVTKHDYPLP